MLDSGGYFGLGKHIWSLGPHEMREITIVRGLIAAKLMVLMSDRLRSLTSSSMRGVYALSNSPFLHCIDASLVFRGLDGSASP